jgi:hypothetical protein
VIVLDIAEVLRSRQPRPAAGDRHQFDGHRTPPIIGLANVTIGL